MTAPRPEGGTTTGEGPVVLFVDDEQDVLDGLRSSLRCVRKTYRFRFAAGADEAMTIVEREPIDLVVTDMRMPGVNGVELLRRIQTEHPGVVRYVLSGEAEQELVVQAVPVAHRWLTKPCDRDVMIDALADAVSHRRLLSDPETRAAVFGAGAIPTPPALYAELHQLLADSEVPMADVARLIGRDPAISAKILQWANSAFSGGTSTCDLPAAVVRVGLSAISQMVLLAEVFKMLDPPDAIPGLGSEVLRHHVTAISSLAGELTQPKDAAAARLGGLFSHVGLLLEAAYLPDRLGEAYRVALDTDSTLIDTEEELFGISHPAIGGHLLSAWGLPSEVVLPAAASGEHPAGNADLPLDPIAAVQAARLIAQGRATDGDIGAPHLDRLEPELQAAVERWEASRVQAGKDRP